MALRGRASVIALVLAFGVAACGSFDASIGREAAGGTAPPRSDAPTAPAASASPDGSRAQTREPAVDDGEPPADPQEEEGGPAPTPPGDGERPDVDRDGGLERIRFASGATSATVEGTITQGVHDRYVFEAREGQTVRIAVTSPSDAVNYGLRDPDGQPIKRVEGEPRTGEFELAATGDHVVSLASAIERSAYTLTVEIE
jgi:hypothetical protein